MARISSASVPEERTSFASSLPLASRSPSLPPDLAAPPSLFRDRCSYLSPREQEIARLVASGMANKEIGLALGISHWTVSAHLRRIFLKLEIDRRIDLCILYRATVARSERPPNGVSRA